MAISFARFLIGQWLSSSGYKLLLEGYILNIGKKFLISVKVMHRDKEGKETKELQKEEKRGDIERKALIGWGWYWMGLALDGVVRSGFFYS